MYVRECFLCENLNPIVIIEAILSNIFTEKDKIENPG